MRQDKRDLSSLWGDFNGLLQVMASLAEWEGLRGKVQCIYLDPQYDSPAR